MRNLFALVGAATVTFVGLGWYLGWYNLSRQPGTPGTQRFQVDVNPNKFTNDVEKSAERVGEIYEHLTKEGNKPDQPTSANSSGAPGDGATNSTSKPADATQPVNATATRR